MELESGGRRNSSTDDEDQEEYDEEPTEMRSGNSFSEPREEFRSSTTSGTSERASMFRKRLLSVSKQSSRRISLLDPRRVSMVEMDALPQVNARKNSQTSSVTISAKEASAPLQGKNQSSIMDDGTIPNVVAKEKRLSILGVKAQGPLKGIRRSSRDKELKRTARKDIWKNSTNVKFDMDIPASGFSSLPGHHVDELAIERSSEGYWKHRLADKSQAILHHRDSIIGVSKQIRNELGSAGNSKVQQPASVAPPTIAVNDPPPKKPPCPFMMALKRLPPFADCSCGFLSLLASSGEQMRLKAGEVRDMDGSRVAVARVRPAMAVVVVSGTLRIEIAGVLVDECSAGASFGLATMFSRVSIGSGQSDAQGTLVNFVVRASNAASSEGCRLLAIHSTALKSALTAFPEDLTRLHDILRLGSQQLVNVTQHIVALLHCSESAKSAIMESTTRHIFVAGECICHEGMRSPDGMVVVRSGIVTLEINGIKIRQLSKGQGIGEEILFGVCRKWGVTARCTTLCDIQVLHRRLFTHWVKEMQHSSADERRESDRLLLFLEGRWREDRVILAWPLFRGYDQDLLATLARLIETRILLPGNKLWECGGSTHQAVEVALYVLLCGSCEEHSTIESQAGPGRTSEFQKSKRKLVPGACIGTRNFLGLANSCHMVVSARTLCIVAVLHRDVFINAIDTHLVDVPQAAEITRLLKESLDQNPNATFSARKDRGCECLVGALPMFKGVERRLVEKICNVACKRRFCIAGQSLCRADARATTMFNFIRGSANLTIDGIHIKRMTHGEFVNVLALAEEAYWPTYSVKCEQTCEVWALSRDDFALCLSAFPQEKGKFNELLRAPSDLRMKQIRPPLALCDHQSRPPSTNPSPVMLDSPRCAKMSLSEVKMFQQCAPAFLEWIAARLHAMIFFPDEIIVREGHEDTGLYIIRSGTIIGEGEGTPQVRLESGGTIGEEQILGISLASMASYQVIDVAVVQVLHQCVWRKGLELFPNQAPLFDKLILSRMDGVAKFELRACPFFSNCNKDFCSQVERIIRTKLMHPGAAVLEEGSEDKVIRIIKSGTAVAHDEIVEHDPSSSRQLSTFKHSSSKGSGQKTREPTKHTHGAVLNVDVAVGATRCATTKVVAETLIAVGEIDGVAFLGVLQRFPNEIVPLVRVAVSGLLWPHEADSVPLFRGVSSRFFESLMSKSAWRMFLPEQCVVKQGGKGDLLFLLCYGVAATELDDITVGNLLAKGDCVGKLNFFGLVTRYSETVRTRIVCHFRSVAGSVLADLLQDHVAERERFEALRGQAQAEAAENEVLFREQVTRDKLRRREQHAFRGHIARERECRGVAPVASTSSLASLLDAREMPDEVLIRTTPEQLGSEDVSDGGASEAEEKPTNDTAATDKNDMQLNMMRKSMILKPGVSHLGTGGKSAQNEIRASFVHRMRGKSRRQSKLHGDSRASVGSRPSIDPASSELSEDTPQGSPRSGKIGTISELGTPKQSNKSKPEPLKGLSFSENVEGASPTSSFGDSDEDGKDTSAHTPPKKSRFGLSSPTDSDDDEIDQKIFFSKMQELTQLRSMSKRDMLDMAISEHAEARDKAMLKGRMLRMFHADLRPNSCVRANLSQEDLHELTVHLPRLSAEAKKSCTSDFFAGQQKDAGKNYCSRKQERAAKASPGRPPMRSLSKAAQQMLQRKCRQLAGNFGAVVPTAI